MVTRIGFLDDNGLSYGEILSETDAGDKYKVTSTETEGSEGSAELIVSEFDTSIDLDATNGLDIKTISSGPLEDKHDNYRSKTIIDDFSDGVSRLAIKDYNETPAVWKSRDEYWSVNAFDFIPQNPIRTDYDVRTGHSDGEVLYHAVVSASGPVAKVRYVAVSTRNDSTRTWGAYVRASDLEDITYSTTEDIELAPTFLTIPGLGTLLFYFSLEGGLATGHSDQLIKVFITKDHGDTWEKYTSIILNPFYGNVSRVGYYPYALEGACSLKATYYNGKIVLGMILHGTDSASPPDTFEINCARIMNLMVSDNLGKSWSVVPQEFITSSFYKEVETGQAHLYGSPASSDIWEIPLNFALGYDISSDKFVLALRSSGEQNLLKDPNSPLRFEEFSKLFFYYNVADDLFEWESTDVDMNTYKLVDSFTKGVEDYAAYDTADVGYEVLDISGSAGGSSLWYTDGNTLSQSSHVNGPHAPVPPGGAYVGGDVYGGTQLVYKKDSDPTCNRTVGIRCRMKAGAHLLNTDTITAFANAGGGDVEATSVGHGLSAGDKVDISGSPNYNGTYYIKSVTEDTFNFTATWVSDDSPATWTIQTGSFGFGFCRKSSYEFYAVSITATSITSGICQVNLKKVYDNAGTITEVYLTKTVGGSAFQKVDLGQDMWVDISVVFAGDELISVFYNDTYLFSAEDDYFRTGEVFFFSNNHDTAHFDDFGLLTSTIVLGVPATNLEGTPSADYPRLGNNIDIAVDMFGQSWICSETTCIGADFSANDTLDYYKRSNITLQKFRLGRAIERVEGSFLASDKHVVLFGDSEEFQQDSGYYFSVTDYAIVPVNTAAMKRTYLSKFVWHKDSPVFMVQTQDDVSLEQTGIFERRGYSDISLNPNFGSYWHAFSYGLDPIYCGWETSPSFTYTSGANDSILQITQDDVGYFFQEYTLNSFSLSSYGNYTMPVRYFDYYHRGATFYFVMRSPSGNDASSERTVLEFYMPYMDENTGGSPTGIYIRYRVRINEGTGGATGSIRLEEYISGTGWVAAGSTYTNIDPTVWREFLVTVVPTIAASNTNTEPEISLYFKEEDEEYWTTVVEGHEPTSSNTGVSRSVVQFGCFGSTGSTQNRTEWKLAAYSDTCYVDPAINRIRGETIQSGEDIRLTKGISISLSGGNTYLDDEWNIIDVSRRAFPKENVVKRPATVWQSDDDSADKSIVIDSKQRKQFDTIVLTGVNCRDILFEANDTDAWGSPSLQLQLDMTEFDHIQYENFSGRDNILKLYANAKKDALLGKRFICEDAALGSYRILSNADAYVVYETDTVAVIPYSALTRYLDILSSTIAFKFTTPKVYRYFRITCQKNGMTYPTPEGAFQIGQIFIGMFNQFQANPEYTINKSRKRNVTVDANLSGGKRTKREGRSSTRRDFNFLAIDMRERGFSEQIRNFFRNARGRRIVYVEDIEEFTHSDGTYTFSVMPCFVDDKLNNPYQKGNLTSMNIALEEDI